jgi:hypothetical protein
MNWLIGMIGRFLVVSMYTNKVKATATLALSTLSELIRKSQILKVSSSDRSVKRLSR